jgi:hypothetical protein
MTSLINEFVETIVMIKQFNYLLYSQKKKKLKIAHDD